MKIRLGFVTNSSSSSFVVLFPHKPENVAELQQLLFGDRKTFYQHWDDSEELCVEGALRIFNDLIGQQSATDEELIEELDGDAWDDPRMQELERRQDELRHDQNGRLRPYEEIVNEMRAIWDEQGAMLKTIAAERLAEFKRDYPDAFYARFSYSDNDGRLSTALEHGEVFQNLVHVRISHH